MAKAKKTVGQLLDAVRTDPRSLDADELEEARRLQRMLRQGKKAEDQKPARNRRISEKYRKRFDAIARTFVACGRNKAETARRVRAELKGLESFKPDRLTCWSGDPEWDAALESAQLQASAERELPPDVRGSKLLHFAQGALADLDDQYAKVKGEGGDNAKELAALEKRIIVIHDAVRAEEKHQDNLKTAAALRTVKNLIAKLVGITRECGSIDEYLRKLQEYKREPHRLLGLKIE